jgi:Ca-activated chloride channel family protein
LRVSLDKPRARAGETVRIAAQASGNARTITARVYGALPVALRWNSSAKANTGELVIPPHLPPGRYVVHVTAEDIAHNIGAEEASLEIW